MIVAEDAIALRAGVGNQRAAETRPPSGDAPLGRARFALPPRALILPARAHGQADLPGKAKTAAVMLAIKEFQDLVDDVDKWWR